MKSKKKKKNVKKYLQRKMIRKIHMTKFITFICAIEIDKLVVESKNYYKINIWPYVYCLYDLLHEYLILNCVFLPPGGWICRSFSLFIHNGSSS